MPTQKKKPARKRTSLILAASEGDSNMLYATGFFVPDPFIFFEHLGRTHVVMSDLEIDRAKKEANVDSVLSLSDYWRRLKRQGKATGTGDVLELIFKERGIHTLEVPSNFPVLFADDLRSRRFTVAVKKDPFFDEREKKSPMEVKKIQDSIRVAEIGLEAGIKVLKRARIGKDRYLYLNGRRLTSEAVKTIVNTSIMALGWVPSHTIIAGGDQCCDPHNEGHGPLRAHTSIIFDIFPRSQKTGSSNRTVKGRYQHWLPFSHDRSRGHS